MKIIYFSSTFYADCDFPLIHELQSQGHEVIYYMPIASFNLKSTLFNFARLYPRTGVFPASVYSEFKEYENELDLSKFYVINQVHKQRFHPLNILLMARVALKMIFSDADVIHVTSAPQLSMRLLYLAKKKLVYTVHDPFMHTGEFSCSYEKARKKAFRNIRRLIVLNDIQTDVFSKTYKIPENNIFSTHLGSYDTISHIKPKLVDDVKNPYILFFGRIDWYKGIDILLKAMLSVKEKCPELTLVVAGAGKLWFDIKPYLQAGNVDLRLRYISLQELAGLLKDCKFCVCPYREATQSGVIQTALTMKVPVLATNVGALPFAIGYGKYGKIVSGDSVTELADSIVTFYKNSEQLALIRKAIEEEWMPSMDWKRIAEDYISCYNTQLK